MSLHRGDLDRLVLERVEAVLIADEQLQRRDDCREADAHAQHRARLVEILARNQVARSDREHDETCREIRSGQHVRKAVRKARIEDDRDPVKGIGDAVPHFEGDGRVHPAVRCENPECGHGGADRDRDASEHVEPRRHAVPAEQHDPEKRRLEEERSEHLVAHKGADDVADTRREPAPVRAELVGKNDPRHHAHCERDREDLRPETRERVVVAPPRAEPHHLERRDVGREPDREAREDDVKGDRESKLDAREQKRIEIHDAGPDVRQVARIEYALVG